MPNASQYQVLDPKSMGKYKPSQMIKVGNAIFLVEGVKPIAGTYKIAKPVTTRLQGFIILNTGKILADPWGTWKGQCVSLAKQWIAFNGWPMLSGNAIDWQYNGDGKHYRFIKNLATTVPKPGDFAIFSVGKFGHIGIVVNGTVAVMQVFGQNYPLGSPAKIMQFNYLKPKCIGFLRKV